jgi:hypothetical protein
MDQEVINFALTQCRWKLAQRDESITDGVIGLWSQRAENSGNAQLFPMVVIGGLVTIIPLVALFLVPQRYWRGGLLLGSWPTEPPRAGLRPGRSARAGPGQRLALGHRVQPAGLAGRAA